MGSTSPPPLDPSACAAAVQVCACFNVRKTARAVTRLFDAALEPSGLRSTQFVTLVSLAGSGPLPLRDLAAALEVERSALTRSLQPLTREGLVRTTADSRGGATVARLTAKGRRVVARGIPLWQEAQSAFVRTLGGTGLEGLLEHLAAARAAAR